MIWPIPKEAAGPPEAADDVRGGYGEVGVDTEGMRMGALEVDSSETAILAIFSAGGDIVRSRLCALVGEKARIGGLLGALTAPLIGRLRCSMGDVS